MGFFPHQIKQVEASFRVSFTALLACKLTVAGDTVLISKFSSIEPNKLVKAS